MTTYRHTPEMGEISGFGGAYEKACQDMLEAGVKWLRAQPEQPVDLQFKGFKGVFGVCDASNENAQKLDEAISAACDDYSSLMHHSVIQRLFYINTNGWQAYCDYLVRAQQEEVDEVA